MSTSGFGSHLTYFPHQKVSDKKKNESFFKNCIDSGVEIVNYMVSNFTTNSTRPSRRNKISNYNLMNDIIDPSEIERIQNPFRLMNVDFPAQYRNYPIVSKNIQILIGEERGRMFNPLVTVINDDAISKYQEEIKAEYDKFLEEQLFSKTFDENKAKEQLDKLNKWANFGYRDKRERMVSQIIDYAYRSLDLKEVFNRGFEDLVVCGEQIYVCDIEGGEPIIRKGNPLNFYTMRSGESNKIEDSDIIVEDGFLPVGEVINRYYEDLSSDDISYLEKGYSTNISARSSIAANQLENRPLAFMENTQTVDVGTLLGTAGSYGAYFTGNFDMEGNVRVTRVVWRGMRQIGIKSWYDENDELQKEVVPEQYVPNKELGEMVKWHWITEWYEGTKIGDLYVRKRPLPTQSRKMDNLSYSHPGIVGTVFNVNSSKGQSLVDMSKDYQFHFNAMMYRLDMLMMKTKKIAKLPLHLIPDGWDIDKALYYADMLGWLPVDAFNEVKKGQAMGKIAGSMNESSPIIDLELGNTIQQTFQMLQFIKNEVDELTGITPQRRGAIDNRETVGGVTRSISQSSLSTEKWFGVNDNTKVRALRAFVETCKVAWKGKSFKRKYILDDGSMAILDFDSDLFNEAEYGINISTALSDMEMMQALKGSINQFVQSGGGLDVVMELYRTKDPASLQRKLETYYKELKQSQQQQQESQIQAQTQQSQIAAQMKQAELDLRRMEIESNEKLEFEKMNRDDVNKQLDRQAKIEEAQLKAMGFAKDSDLNDNSIPDVIEQGKLAAQQLKINFDSLIKNKDIDSKMILEREKMKSAKQLQKQKDDAALERERLKARTAIKNVVSGEHKK